MFTVHDNEKQNGAPGEEKYKPDPNGGMDYVAATLHAWNQCPTIVKSQSRGIKDGTYIQTEDGRILAPSESVVKRLMSIPDAFDTTWMGSESAIEVLGQSIDYAMHETLMSSVKDHLQVGFGGARTVVNFRQRERLSNRSNATPDQLTPKVMPKFARSAENQLGFAFN